MPAQASYRYALFTKHLQTLTLPEAARTIKDLGFEGADLTVRPKGFVEADRVTQDLPAAVRACHDWGLQIPLLTTDITSATDPAAVPTFEAAAKHDIREIKLGYVSYTQFGTYPKLMEETARNLDGLEQLAAKTGVRCSLHFHSEHSLTALAPIIWYLIKDRNPHHIGAYLDPGHMTVEGGGDGWRMSLDLLKERISLVAIKDFRWEQVDDPKLGKPAWKSKVCPLNEGIVPWPRFFECLSQTPFNGWLSVHSEYQGGRSWKNLSVQELVQQTREDFGYLKGVIEGTKSKS